MCVSCVSGVGRIVYDTGGGMQMHRPRKLREHRRTQIQTVHLHKGTRATPPRGGLLERPRAEPISDPNLRAGPEVGVRSAINTEARYFAMPHWRLTLGVDVHHL
jgi:hypothetical protein